jgi:hypothetical protein
MNEKRAFKKPWNGANTSTREFLTNQIQTGRRTIAPRSVLLLALTILFSLSAAVYFAVSAASAEKKNLEWRRYGHDLANSRFQNQYFQCRQAARCLGIPYGRA